jgi:hypothetical protein
VAGFTAAEKRFGQLAPRVDPDSLPLLFAKQTVVEGMLWKFKPPPVRTLQDC